MAAVSAGPTLGAESHGVALPGHRVDFVDENDGGRVVLGGFEELFDFFGGLADEHVLELAAALVKKAGPALVGQGPRQEGLAGTGRPLEQDSARQSGALVFVAVRALQTVHDFAEVCDHFVQADHVAEFGVLARRLRVDVELTHHDLRLGWKLDGGAATLALSLKLLVEPVLVLGLEVFFKHVVQNGQNVDIDQKAQQRQRRDELEESAHKALPQGLVFEFFAQAGAGGGLVLLEVADAPVQEADFFDRLQADVLADRRVFAPVLLLDQDHFHRAVELIWRCGAGLALVCLGGLGLVSVVFAFSVFRSC